jgi:hypothetical protein
MGASRNALRARGGWAWRWEQTQRCGAGGGGFILVFAALFIFIFIFDVFNDTMEGPRSGPPGILFFPRKRLFFLGKSATLYLYITCVSD